MINDVFEMNTPSGKAREKYMLIDISNHMHRNRHGALKNGGSDEDVAEYAMQLSIQALNKLYNTIKPTKIVACVDHGSWRKAIFPMYKARRHEDRKQDTGYDVFKELMGDFQDLIRDNTSMIYLEQPMVEADDWVGRWIQTHPDDHHVICSTDGDFHQLHAHNVEQYNPVKKEYIDVKDPKFAIFVKCIRGETGRTSDNIPSAYPKIRLTKLESAFYDDKFVMENIMQHKVPDIAKLDKNNEPTMSTTGKLFKRNKHLMDLTQQPDDIIELMDDTIANVTTGKFDMFSILQYFGRHNLVRLSENIDSVAPMMRL